MSRLVERFWRWLWGRPATPPAEPPSEPEGGWRPALLRELNLRRYPVSAAPLLAMDRRLNQEAQTHALAMAQAKRLFHGEPDDGFAGEVIAVGQRTPAEAVDSWMSSPPHRAVLLGTRWTVCGLGRAWLGGAVYWVARVR